MDKIDFLIGKSKPVFVTDKGVKLYVNDNIKSLNKQIKRLNLKNVQAFLAIHADGDIEYLLIKDGEAYYESQKLEDIESCIKMLTLSLK